MTSRSSFKIIEQDTGKVGYVPEPIYRDKFMYICQRALPEFSEYGDDGIPVLYLRGRVDKADEKVISCGPHIYEVLCTLKKAFSEFKILNCNKFVLEK